MGISPRRQTHPIMQANNDDFLQLIRQHLAWYPLMQVRDVYKLIYQGAMGPEHMVATQQEFARRLEVEFSSLQPARSERLLEPVRSDQSLLRLNLRSYKAREKAIDRIIPLLLQTSRQTHGSMEELVNSWTILVQHAEKGQVDSLPFDEVNKFSHWLEREGYPAVHHSQVYRREYQPAYRLLAADLISELGFAHAG